VVAVGGDGTLNEVINGVMASAGARPLVGAVLTGRGRDAARNLGLARDPTLAVERLVLGEEVAIDLGRVVDAAGAARCFVGAAGAGFDAVVAEGARARGGAGTIPYLLAVAGALGRHRPQPAAIEGDGARVWEGGLTAAVVANGAAYGGGMRIAPGADPSDGRLDLVILGALGRAELLRWLPSVYRGAHLRHPRVATGRHRTVRVEAAVALAVHADGEPAGRTPAAFEVLPGALRLLR
jgi:diacylglycerol kinase (ATP)